MKHIIDTDELLDELKRIKSSYGDVFFAKQYAVGVDDAISKIKEIVENSPQVPEGYALMPIEPTDAWIRVEDMMPPYIDGQYYSENVLGLCNGKVYMFNRFFDCAKCEFDDDYEVTHWMPLPQPPKP